MPDDLHLHRFPQSTAISSVRFLSYPSHHHRLLAVATPSSLQLHSLTPQTLTLTLQSSWPSPSPLSLLSPSPNHPSLLAASPHSLHLLLFDPLEGSITLADEIVVRDVTGIDAEGGGREWVSVGEDGRVGLVGVGEGGLHLRSVGDGAGLVSYYSVKWGSPMEFATGGLGLGVEWWDLRRKEGVVAKLSGSWGRGNVTGMVHSIDIHPSRKHICVVGGSSGTVLAWDLRNQRQPVVLSGVGLTGAAQPVSESEVWEIRHDIYSHSASITPGSGKILPIMMCSEDGILAVLEQGEEPVKLLAEYCAINSFDIDPQNPSDVVCALEWESIGVLTRSRESMSMF